VTSSDRVRTKSQATRLPIRGQRLALRARAAAFRRLSTNRAAFANATVVTAAIAVGPGVIELDGVQLGYWPSPGAFTTCTHLDTRTADSAIRIGAGSIVNNGCTFIADGPGIRIGRDALIGWGVVVVDSDFHALDPGERRSGPSRMASVEIGDNVFIGAQAMVLRGVRVGDGAVIGAGAVVVSDVPAGAVVAGNPAILVSDLSAGDAAR
jgi:maltose O-acetyltransferase